MSVSNKTRNGTHVISLKPFHKRFGAIVCLALFSSLALCASPSVIENLLQQDRDQEALTASNEYLNNSGGSAEARFLRGVALAKTGQTDAAIEVFGELARENPASPEYANNLAVLYAQKGEYEKARRWLEAAMSTHPAYATAHRNLGDVYTALAAVAYSKALDQKGQAADLGVDLELVQNITTENNNTQIAQADVTAPAPTAPPRIIEAPEPMPEPARPPQPEPAPPVVSAPAPEPTPAPEPVEPPPQVAQPAPPVTPPATSQAGILQSVRAWARAWSDQNVEGYLDSYASNFYPGDDQTLAQWRAQRRDRVSSPQRINVEIIAPKVQLDADGRARVTFRQRYSADTYSDLVTKTLILERKAAGWRIVREISSPL